MTKYITVQGPNHQAEYTEDNLPFTVGEKGQCEIGLMSCSETVGLVGAEGGHLFFQPVDSGQALFFNSRQITSSVWLKSGDRLEVGSAVVLFSVVGDRYTFSIGSREENDAAREAAFSSPRPTNNKNGESLPLEILPVAEKKTGRTLLYLSLAFLGFLLVCSIFLLLAKPITIQVTPEPDQMYLSGFPPPFSLGERYLAWSASYTLVAEKKGYSRLEAVIEVEDTENNFSFELKKLPGKLKVKLTPAEGVAIFVDDIQVGSTQGVVSADVFDILPGGHTLRFEKSRYLPFETQIDIKGESQAQVVEASLDPAWSSLLLLSEPDGAVIWVDGERQGGTTPSSIELLQGNHIIAVTKQGYLDETLEVHAIAGQDEKSSVTLTPTPAAITVTSDPEGTTVLVDGDFQGVTPLKMQLPADKEVDIVLQSAGFVFQSKGFRFKAGEEKTLHFTMEKEYGIVFFQVNPPTALLFIDGKKQPDSNGRMKLPVKTLNIEVRHPQYGRYTSSVTPKKSYSQQVNVNLASEGGAGSSLASSQKNKKSGDDNSLILIRPAEFMMGAPRREAGRRANEQERKVVLEKAFYVSPKLVTNGEYRRFNSQHSSGVVGRHTLDSDNQPVVNITWKESVLYLNWLSKQEELAPFYRLDGEKVLVPDFQGTGYRLPTEAEWAYLARKAGRGERMKYPWGEGFPPYQVSGNYGDVSAGSVLGATLKGYNDSFAVSSPVGSFPPNSAGLYDMGGNVAEWCHDFYAAYNPAKTSTSYGPKTGSLHVIRGSSWRDYTITELRLSYRRYHKKAQDDVGFRVARYVK